MQEQFLRDKENWQSTRRMTAAASAQIIPAEGWRPAGRRPCAHGKSGPVQQVRSTAASKARVPVWLAALIAARCQAEGEGENHTIGWDCVSGRAIYTNSGATMERIEPLGVSLQRGQTLAVSWRPGETTYTVEVYGKASRSRT
jgi:hypothetical protein